MCAGEEIISPILIIGSCDKLHFTSGFVVLAFALLRYNFIACMIYLYPLLLIVQKGMHSSQST